MGYFTFYTDMLNLLPESMAFGEVGQYGQEEDGVVDVHHEREQVRCLVSSASLSILSFIFVHHQIFSDGKHHCGEQRA